MQALPLVDRAAGAILFRTPRGAVGVHALLADARRLAATLPERAQVANLCRDRYAFAVGLVAALLRGQVSLLTGEPTPGTLARLAQDHPDAYALTDQADPAELGAMARHAVPPHPGHGEPAAAGPVPALPADRIVAIVLTSGSTGRPVGTAKCWGELVARSRAAGERFALSEAAPACLVATVPPGHMYGLELSVLLPLHAACTAWCGPAFFPADVAAALAGMGGPAMLVTTPLHLRALLEAPPPPDPPARVVSATAPLEAALAARAERSWGCTVHEILGATEVGSIASRRTVASDHWELYPGVALAGSGEAPVVAAPGAPPRPLADVVELAADGRRFRLLGRAGDLVKRGGRRASLAGLTRILLAVPGVADGAFLLPDAADGAAEDGPGSRLAAVAVAPGHSADSLAAALRGEIDPVFLPRPLLLLDALPRNATGKLPREALLALLAGRGDDAP